MPATAAQTKQILVVIDAVQLAKTAVGSLQDAGYQTILVNDGSKAVSAYMEHRPDAVVMDTKIPVINGYEAIRAIRNFDQEKTIPILMLTEPKDLNAIEQAFQAGATDFVIQSQTLEHLAHRVQYALRNAEERYQLERRFNHLSYAQKLAKIGYLEWDCIEDEVCGSTMSFDLFGIPAQTHIKLEQLFSHVVASDLPIIHQAIHAANQGQKHIEVSFRVNQRGDNPIHLELLGNAVFDEQQRLIKIIASVQDISRLHRDEGLIHYQTTHDMLTGLPNRNHFYQLIAEFVHNRKQSQIGAVILLDIDRFKQVNLNLGQEEGDNLLRALSQRLSRVIREADSAARLASDEFGLLIRNVFDQQELNMLLNRIHQDLSSPFIVNNQELFLSFSFGVAVLPSDGDNADDLLNNANIARSKAKQNAGNQFVFFEPHLHRAAQDQLSLENELRRALERDEIMVYFQPQVDATTLQPYGAEALVRWQHPRLGVISPTIFVPLAESTGLIIEIGRFVLRQAIAETEKWHSQGFDNMHIGINLSGRQFASGTLMQDVQHCLADCKLPAQMIDLEITESLAMNDAQTNINILNGLKALGISLSIDDFGTGYSSLAYLHRFPIDTIKIDQSFVQNLDTKDGQAIARTILAMADSLHLDVVAEGIETDEQAAFFDAYQQIVFQGFKYGKPMTACEFNHWLQQFTT